MHKLPPQSDAWNFVAQGQAAEWFDGLPIGNGDLGALLLPDQQRLQITLAKSDLWHTECDDGTGRAASFYPFDRFADLCRLLERGAWEQIEKTFAARRAQWKGHFALRCAGAVVLDTSRFEKEIELLDFRRHLDMRTGQARSTYRTRIHQQTTEALVSTEHEVLVLRVCCDLDWRKGDPVRPMQFGMDISITQPAAPPDAEIVSSFRENRLCQIVRAGDDTHAIALMVRGKGVRLTGDGGPCRLIVTGTNRVDFTLTVAVTRGPHAARDAVARIRRADAAGYAAIRARHVKSWRAFWNRSAVTVPDDRMLRQYHFGLYLLASSSRRGFQMPGLQGLWYTRAPGTKWNEYTNDLNIQMNYWPIYTSNHLELGWPYYDTVRNWLPEAQRYTRDYWGCRGVQFSCCASPTGIVPAAYLTTMHWAGCAAFVAQNFWTHFRYSHDQRFLREVAFPFLKECAAFYLDFLKLDSRGYYEIWPSNSPEAGEGSYEAWGKNPTMDIALLRFLFAAVVQAAKILGCEDKFARACNDRLVRLPPYPVRDGALIDMESKEFLYSHRHNGIITPIYPCDDVAGPLARRTVARFMQKGRWLWGCHTIPWQAAAYARIGRAEEARDLLVGMFDSFLPPDGGFNLNYNYHRRHGGIAGPAIFCNESNSGFSAALLEMLLQSQRDVIHVFPAIPKDWKDVEFQQLLAQGAFEVSARRAHGQTRTITIKSLRGGRIQVKNPWPRADVLHGRKRIALAGQRRMLTWDTQPGAVYQLQPSKP